ncbi:UNVERIFIED_CONTAM: hypothetical protein GTU68_040986 [Idotea baltica]|nr:hypothetical protein [Idotea baltica]
MLEGLEVLSTKKEPLKRPGIFQRKQRLQYLSIISLVLNQLRSLLI